jgi:hypothetical protein
LTSNYFFAGNLQLNFGEILQFYSGVDTMVMYYKDNLHKKHFVFYDSHAENLFSYMQTPITNNISRVTWDFDSKRFEAEMTYFNKKGKIATKKILWKINEFPVFDISLYHFDFIYAMRHYIGDKAEGFEVNAMYGNNCTENTVVFEKKEVVDGVFCDKWIIQRKGILAKVFKVKQEIWFAKDSPYYYMVQYKNYMNKITPIGDIFITLLSIEKKSPADWHEHIANLTEEARIRLGFPLKKLEKEYQGFYEDISSN